MNYQITITKKVPNPNFEAELAEWKERNKYNLTSRMDDRFNEGYPKDANITNALICELTEEQFKAVKAEVFKTFN